MYHILLIPSPVDGHLGRFHLLAIVSSAAVNVGVQVFVWACVLSLGYVRRSGVAGSCDNSVSNFLRNHLVAS